MFPTKALAQDQRAAMQRLLEAAFPDNPPSVEVYDGDTPHADRPCIRDRAQLLVTNPDMLHVSILPSHASFDRFLSRLRYVVVDESHMYALTSLGVTALKKVISRQYLSCALVLGRGIVFRHY
jgi:DEAD/DEAH box helicase domain-containing protein